MTPLNSVRFYIRTYVSKDDTPVPLRLKVWSSADRKWLYASTDIRISKKKFHASFSADGTPCNGTERKLAIEVERYRVATLYVIYSALVANMPEILTSDYLNSQVKSTVSKMRGNVADDKEPEGGEA